MAPFVGPSRAALVRLLRSRAVERRLPITLGEYSPQAIVERDRDGRWLLRPLVLDEPRAREAGRRALAGGGSWMPEHEWEFLVPGEPLASAPALDQFIALIEKLSWTFGGRD